MRLEENDHLLECPFCRVRLYAYHHPYPCLHLPPQIPANRGKLVYVPYWRLRGLAFAVVKREVVGRVIDVAESACGQPGFPPSLGIRPQALTLKPMEPDAPGTFLPRERERRQFISHLSSSIAAGLESHGTEVYHHALVGETVSLIYAPYLVTRHEMIDALNGKTVGSHPLPSLNQSGDSAENRPPTLLFHATLCPNCGWALEGHPDSLTLHCTHCHRAWHANRKGFLQVPLFALNTKEKPDIWIPYWVIGTEATGFTLNSVADFLKLTNQPRLPRREDTQRPFYFWTPACKLNPNLFIHMGARLTMRQPHPEPVTRMPQEPVYTNNLPPVEGFQSALTTLAQVTTAKGRLFPRLRGGRLAFKSYRMALVPFCSRGMEYWQPEFGFSFPKAALRWGKAI